MISARTQRANLSIILPCLNEADTIARCLDKIHHACSNHDIDYEIVVADNGSTDDSPRIAVEGGARLVSVADRGYGAALKAGIARSSGRYVVMADADDSYDFRDLRIIYEKLLDGYELVLGCRFPRGGGSIAPGAMPWSHRRLGNPLFTFLVRTLFRSGARDVYCGLRGFRREWFDRLQLGCPDMVFAVEMVVRAAQVGSRVANVPITLHPDGRLAHGPHLNTLRDGWKTLTRILGWWWEGESVSAGPDSIVARTTESNGQLR